MTNRQLFTWFIRILVDSLNYIERIMDRVHHCSLILTSRLCAIFTVTCVVPWHEQQQKKKIQEHSSVCNSNWWVVCICANYQICESRCPSKYFYTYLPIKLPGDLHMDRPFREIKYLFNSLFFHSQSFALQYLYYTMLSESFESGML